MNQAEKALNQYARIKNEVDFILNYFERGLTYNREWLENRLVELGADLLEIERDKPKTDITLGKNTKPSLDYQQRRAKMSRRERFEYDYPDFEG